MKTYISSLSFIIIIVLLSSHKSMAQPIDFEPNANVNVRVTHLNPSKSEVLDTLEKNLRRNALLPEFFDLFSSNDGRLLAYKDKVIKQVDGDYKLLSLPVPEQNNFNEFYFRVSANGKIIMHFSYVDGPATHIRDFTSTLTFLDAENGSLLSEFVYEGNMTDLSFNLDASVFAFNSLDDEDNTNHAYIVERKYDTFEVFPVVGGQYNPPYGRFLYITSYALFLSSTGDRMIFQAQFVEGEGKVGGGYFYVDRMEEGWSELKELLLYDAEGNELQFKIFDIANNGRTLLIRTPSDPLLPAVVQKLAVVHEENRIWGVPEYLPYTPQTEQGKGADEFQISEDGNVVAVQSFKEYTWDQFVSNDALIYFKTPAGNWVKRQVNPPNVLVLSNITLTEDGSRLFWLPFQEPLSVPASEFMK